MTEPFKVFPLDYRRSHTKKEFFSSFDDTVCDSICMKVCVLVLRVNTVMVTFISV